MAPGAPAGDRRPLRSRERSAFQRLAAWCIGRGIAPDAISMSSLVFAGVAAAALAGTAVNPVPRARVLFVLAAIGIQLRLLANMLDGMVAVGSGQASRLGDLFNEVPDRIADTAILIGAGYAAGGSIAGGYLAAVMALFVSYLRAVGGAHQVTGLFLGPMAKPHRMFTLTVACLFAAAWPAGFTPTAGIVAAALWLIVAGGVVTALRRLRRIVAVLESSP